MKKLLVYLRPYRLQAILAPCFKLLEAAFELLVPLIMADIIDVGISSGDTAYILKKCLVLVGLGLCGFASATCAQYFSAKAATGATGRLRRALFAHIQSLSYAELDRLGTATLVTRMTSDMNQVQTGLNLTLRLLLRSPIVVFGAMLMAFTIDTKSALIFAVAIPVLFAVVFAIMLSCIPLYRRVQTKLDGVTGAAQENLSGVRTIYNPVPIYMGDKPGALTVDYGVAYFTLESREEAAAILDNIRVHAPFEGDFTRGLYFKGTN